jgi:ParB family transcriptional regulator, chromosome partitioning protein
MHSPERPRRLGRGLEALLGASGAAPPGADLHRIPLSRIRPNPYQPRRDFAPEDLEELQASLKANGLLQPITVRTAASGAGYELIAGERRLRAATALGWTDIPAIVRELDDRALLTLALVENLQRADLNPVEEAEGYQRLQDGFGLTQQQIAEAVGRDRATVANTLRLLALPAGVRRLLAEGKLSAGHGRALLALREESAISALAKEAVAAGMSVREVERRARTDRPSGKAVPPRREPQQSAEARRIEDQLRRHLQTDVKLDLEGSASGEIRIRFYTNDDLARILELIVRPD